MGHSFRIDGYRLLTVGTTPHARRGALAKALVVHAYMMSTRCGEGVPLVSLMTKVAGYITSGIDFQDCQNYALVSHLCTSPILAGAAASPSIKPFSHLGWLETWSFMKRDAAVTVRRGAALKQTWQPLSSFVEALRMESSTAAVQSRAFSRETRRPSE